MTSLLCRVRRCGPAGSLSSSGSLGKVREGPLTIPGYEEYIQGSILLRSCFAFPCSCFALPLVFWGSRSTTLLFTRLAVVVVIVRLFSGMSTGLTLRILGVTKLSINPTWFAADFSPTWSVVGLLAGVFRLSDLSCERSTDPTPLDVSTHTW